MKVRQLIQALQAHDQDMDVVIPADPSAGGDFALISMVVADVFAPSNFVPGALELAELRDRGAYAAVRLCGTGRSR